MAVVSPPAKRKLDIWKVISYVAILAAIAVAIADSRSQDRRIERLEGPRGIQGESGDRGKRGKSARRPPPKVIVRRGKAGESIVGPEGDKGDKGDKGDRGVRGLHGRTGRPGRDGLDGKPGVSPPPVDIDALIAEIIRRLALPPGLGPR